MKFLLRVARNKLLDGLICVFIFGLYMIENWLFRLCMADGQHSKKLVMLGLTVGLLAYAWRASKAFLEVVFVFLRVLSVFFGGI